MNTLTLVPNHRAPVDLSLHGLQPSLSPREAIARKGWFTEPGAYVLFDGQFGSTGKGVLAAYLAEHAENMDVITTNAGPNSGHTAWIGGKKFVHKQVPISAARRFHDGHLPSVSMNGGAVIELDTLCEEWAGCSPPYSHPANRHCLWVSPFAAHTEGVEELSSESLRSIASTGKGTGGAIARKVMRDREGVVGLCRDVGYAANGLYIADIPIDKNDVVFVEVSQGFSLGINAGFYPYCTSRDCTVGAALADAQISPRRLRKSVASLRTFPIRVGNTAEGTSGGWYSDQHEIEWGQIGVEPELTTVTKRQRRIATWSDLQFQRMLEVNEPDALFLNFVNYLDSGAQERFVQDRLSLYHMVMGKDPDWVLLGYGPTSDDCILYA